MTEVVLGQPLPANVRMRDVPWGSKPGQAVSIPDRTDDNSQIQVSSEVSAALAEMSLEQPESTSAVKVSDILPPAVAAPAPVPVDDSRMSRLEKTMADFIEMQTKANTPAPAALVPVAPTSIDINRLRANPLQALKEAGIDISAFAPHMPGAQVAPEQRLELTAASLRSELEATLSTKMAELEARESQFMAQQRQVQIQSGLKAIDATLYPTTANMVRQVDDPDFLQSSIAQGFDVLKAQGNPNPTMADVLSALEVHWSKFAKWTAPATVPQANVPAQTAATPVAAPSVAAPKSTSPPPRVRGWDQPVNPERASALKTFLEDTRELKFR